MLLVRIECHLVIFYPQRPLLSVYGTDMILIPLTNIIAIVRATIPRRDSSSQIHVMYTGKWKKKK